ncbi:MAG: queuine tRNA-ribosyltransferase family protein, partial [Muribaculaceae bacterium]|nr:queuine tRNA-ribosyltransferase family protein [Muribaculaceae bacterium]
YVPAEGDRIYTKAFVRHLFIADELLAMQIASIHNLAFYLWLVGEARRHIIEGDFASWKRNIIPQLSQRL